MQEFPETACLIIQPIPFILSPIRPFLNAKSISNIVLPFPFINCPRLESIVKKICYLYGGFLTRLGSGADGGLSIGFS